MILYWSRRHHLGCLLARYIYCTSSGLVGGCLPLLSHLGRLGTGWSAAQHLAVRGHRGRTPRPQSGTVARGNARDRRHQSASCWVRPSRSVARRIEGATNVQRCMNLKWGSSRHVPHRWHMCQRVQQGSRASSCLARRGNNERKGIEIYATR
jgi:hypothetical protein